VERGGESGNTETDDKEAREIYFVEIFRIEKQIGNAQVFSETSGDHRKENHPA
jgi:hypothetical protein